MYCNKCLLTVARATFFGDNFLSMTVYKEYREEKEISEYLGHNRTDL